MPDEKKEVHLLMKVLADLEDFLPFLVLVGGWVPYLYVRHLWPGIRHEPLTTVDIDFGFKNVSYRGKETIADRVRKKHYGEHHLSMDRLIPFVPVVKLEKEGLKADVEFITAPGTSNKVRDALVGREIKINEVNDFEILLEFPMALRVGNQEVRVPDPVIFTFHKLLTFAQREREDKQRKDLYYAYYLLFFHPEKEKFVFEISQLIKKRNQGNRVKENIQKYFEDSYAKGPGFIAEEAGSSAIKTFISDIRQDAYERVTSLIK